MLNMNISNKFVKVRFL